MSNTDKDLTVYFILNTELAKMTSKKSSDPRDLIITEALENICKPYNFVNYDFSPPKTVKACQLLLGMCVFQIFL